MHTLLVIPVASLASVTVVRLFMSPFLVYKNRDAEARRAEEALKKRHTHEEMCSDLGDLYAEAADLRNEEVPPSEAYLDAWVNRFNSWRERTLDTLVEFGMPAEYALFQNADASGRRPVRLSVTNISDQVEAYDAILDRHQIALQKILENFAKALS